MIPVSHPSTRLASVVGAALLTIALAACNTAGSPSPEASSEASAPASAAAATTTIIISGSSFGPDLTLPAGTVIVFENHDGFGHTATEGENGTADPNARFDFSLADGQTSDPVTLEAGVYHVTCKIHPGMNLTITVN